MQAEPLTPAIVQETINRHWTDRAATFDDDPDHGLHSEAQRQAWLTLLQRWSGATPLDALDVGCGTGFLALLLAGLGHRAVGVDGAEAMLTLGTRPRRLRTDQQRAATAVLDRSGDRPAG